MTLDTFHPPAIGGAMLAMMALFACMIAGCAAVLSAQLKRESRVADRMRAVRQGGAAAATEAGGVSAIAGAIGRLGTGIARSGILPGKTVKDLQATLDASGFNSRNGLGLFIGCKLLMGMGVPVLFWFGLSELGYAGTTCKIGAGIGLAMGMLGPDYVIGAMRRRHLKAVERGLADALDMMVICAEAGLPLEPTILRVGKEIRPAHPDISAELLQTANEMRIVADHRAVLMNLGIRTGLVGCKRLGTTLVQTIQYGTPLTEALRVLATEMRGEMITRFEARAARLPVLLTLPMIVFILPCVFLVVGGPAIIQVMHVFKG